MLPDEAPRTSGGISFTAGALDGVLGLRAGSDAQLERAQRVAELIVRAAGKQTRRRLRKLYDAVNTAGGQPRIAPTRPKDDIDPDVVSGRRCGCFASS